MSEKAEYKTGWQSEVTSLKQGVLKLYETKDFSDCAFAMKGDQDNQDKKIKAHKLILASRSSYFQRMINAFVPDPVIIEEESITRTGFEILLRFIYTDNIGTEDKKSIVEAFIAADYFDQFSLKIVCERKIASWTIVNEDVWQLLDVGLTIDVLKDKCIEFIERNVNEAFFSPSFLSISYGCLNAVLDSGVLNQLPVMQRIDRIFEWVANHQTEPLNYDFIRKEFENGTPPLLDKLGLEALNMPEMSILVKKYKGFITPDELMGFALYCNGDYTQLPPWCHVLE